MRLDNSHADNMSVLEQTHLKLETPRPDQETQDAVSHSQPTQQLKPIDGGRDAWVVLIAAVIFEAFFWGTLSDYFKFKMFGCSILLTRVVDDEKVSQCVSVSFKITTQTYLNTWPLEEKWLSSAL